jgi:signal transduction histidine kinase/FixJ family two-component response regulator
MSTSQICHEAARRIASGQCATATLEEVDIRSELQFRPHRAPDYAAEHGALAVLAVEMAENPRNMLQKLVEMALDLCQADTAGISLIEGEVFRWEALAGVHASLRQGTMPRDASPCGICIDQDATQLMHLADRCFPALRAEPRFVEALLIPFHDHGTPVGTVWIVAHNDERKFDAEDERILRTLANFASAGWQLWKAAENAAESSRRKDAFVAMLGHEFRNPLAAILSASESIHRIGGNQSGLKQASEVVTRQARHLCRMVDDLTDLSRLSRGRLDLQKQTVQIQMLVARALEMTRPKIDHHGHHLSVRVPTEPIWMEGDPGRLVQLLSNLLDNAAKYTPDGGEISVVAESVAGQVCIRVRDNGIGIASHQLDAIFDLYAQLDVSATNGSGGLGLGLALVRSLVDLHGGTIEVASDGSGKGSQFTVCLPILPIPAPHAKAKATTNGSGMAPHRRILVVEDNAELAEALREILAIHGHTVCIAHNGQTALERLRSFDPDVVLLDISLPDIDGYQVARKMREDTARRDLIILAISGHERREDQRRSKEAGCDAHLVKPVPPHVLESFLARGVGRVFQQKSAIAETRPFAQIEHRERKGADGNRG